MDRNGQRVPMGVKAGDKVLIPQVCSFFLSLGFRVLDCVLVDWVCLDGGILLLLLLLLLYDAGFRMFR